MSSWCEVKEGTVKRSVSPPVPAQGGAREGEEGESVVKRGWSWGEVSARRCLLPLLSAPIPYPCTPFLPLCQSEDC